MDYRAYFMRIRRVVLARTWKDGNATRRHEEGSTVWAGGLGLGNVRKGRYDRLARF